MTPHASKVGTDRPPADGESLQEAANADLELGVFNPPAPAHRQDASGLDRDRPRIRLVDGAVPLRMTPSTRIDLERPQVDFLGRLTVRREEAGAQPERAAGDRPEPRLFDQ